MLSPTQQVTITFPVTGARTTDPHFHPGRLELRLRGRAPATHTGPRMSLARPLGLTQKAPRRPGPRRMGLGLDLSELEPAGRARAWLRPPSPQDGAGKRGGEWVSAAGAEGAFGGRRQPLPRCQTPPPSPCPASGARRQKGLRSSPVCLDRELERRGWRDFIYCAPENKSVMG